MTSQFSNQLQAAANTQVVGRQLALFINSLDETPSSNIHISGHSLGGQIAGYAGKYWNKINTNGPKIGKITAMDPAGPMFELPNYVSMADKQKVHIYKDDADFVDVIHTTGGSLVGDQGLGMESAVGHADFYPNGGQVQPGCRSVAGSEEEMGLLPDPACHHSKAYEFWISSVTRNCFQSWSCSSYEEFENGTCERGILNTNRLGYWSKKPTFSSKYYLQTIPFSPYCKL